MKKTRLLIIFSIYTLLAGCEMRTFVLKDGITKVPVNASVYKNKSKFDASLLKAIDTTVIYEKYSVENGILMRLDTDPTTKFYGAYRFYSNGGFNFFVMNRTDILDSNSFNPAYNGYRGVYYKKENLIRHDLFAGSNGMGWIGRLPGTFTFSGDTLYVDSDFSDIEIYIKRSLPSENLDYHSTW